MMNMANFPWKEHFADIFNNCLVMRTIRRLKRNWLKQHDIFHQPVTQNEQNALLLWQKTTCDLFNICSPICKNKMLIAEGINAPAKK